jgi:uncharacterized protein involved in outer membrane biogenesis
MKRIVIVGGVVVALALVAALMVIDTIAARAIETGVEAGLGVPAQVGSVRLRLLLGSFGMDDLQIDNAPGYDAEHFLSLGRTETSISFAALRRGEVVLDKLLLSDLVVDLEWQGRKANYDALLEGMSSAEADDEAEAKAEADDADASATTFIIDEIVIRNVTARIRVKSKLLNVDAKEVHIPEIKLTGVGRASGGEQLSAITRQVMEKVLMAVLQKSKSAVPQLSAEIGSALGELRGLGGGTGDKVGSVIEKLDEAVGGLLDRLRGGGKD